MKIQENNIICVVHELLTSLKSNHGFDTFTYKVTSLFLKLFDHIQ